MQREWRLAHGRSLTLGPVSVIMGVLNVTPDSFSDGGVHLALDKAIEGARAMIAEGATIIDVGGESTRPGATRVDPKTEQSRVLPVIDALARETDVLISVDTYREETARLAVAAGAHIVNDVWGVQREPAIADLAAETGAGLVIMHTGRERERDPDVIVDQFAFLNRSLEIASLAGVAHDQIVLDPGFGFAKETEENLALIDRFGELQAFGYPFLAGTSRKRFLGAVTGRDADQRDAVTAATSAILRLAGADIFRVHDVRTNRDALAVVDVILQQRSAKT
ncbi:dihydropteroate synthase [Phyllobacterium myrsinacearum]|uniref:Dihydropteroate synthase n=1 Tax=Phyllobacterium myrsinacearum TaxID=28101 RepID=A0A839EET0_9HYPH|nr:dihydropteroate synthase [Phyllobacterium myrsinacearum]MBA8878461.1 dihydropteroate synthase [Phyllobacterium myrsinacearum]